MTTKDYIKAGLTGVKDFMQFLVTVTACTAPVFILSHYVGLGAAYIYMGIGMLAFVAYSSIKTAKEREELEAIKEARYQAYKEAHTPMYKKLDEFIK